MSMLSNLHFLRPLWLLALAPLLGILVLHWRSSAGSSAWRKLVDAHLLPHLLADGPGAPKRLPLVLLGLGWILLVVAMAGPAWDRLPRPVFGATTARVILLDLSPTMNAGDVSPSRLVRARFEILDLLKASSEGQTALLAFGPEPFVVSPLSGDAKTIAAQVPQLSIDLIPVAGPRRTDLALEEAGRMLDQSRAGGADVILVSDGVGGLAGALDEARRLAAKGHRLSILAVGTAEGAPIPSPDGGFVQDDSGGIEIAHLARAPLRELARAGGGRYLEAGVGDRDTRALIDEGARPDAALEKTTLAADQWREEGPWLLLLLLPVAALAFRRGWLMPVVLLALVLPAPRVPALGWSDLWLRADQQAAREMAAGRAGEAAGQFEDPAWRAAASYKAGRFEDALETVSRLPGPDAAFNRGNALTRLGRLEDAIAAYEDALEARPDDADAQHNLDLVRRLLEQKEKQEPRQQDQGDRQDSTSERGPGDKGGQAKPQDGQQGQDSQRGRQDQGERQAGQPGQASDPGQGASGDPPTSQDAAQGGSEDERQPAGDASEASDASSDRDGRGRTGEPSPATDRGQGSPSAAEPSAPAKAGEQGFSQEALRDGAQPSSEASASRTGEAQHGLARAEDEGAPNGADGQAAIDQRLSPEDRERQQALEAQLRRVPDDPAGLIRQRFLLQHLRREGRLP